MRTSLLVAAGAFLCLIIEGGINVFWFVTQPVGAITNVDYPLIRITDIDGTTEKHEYELHKGESKPFGYGEFTIFIPDTKASFVLFKNSRGTCNIRSASGILLVTTNSNANIPSPAR